MEAVLDNLEIYSTALILLPERNSNVEKSANNLLYLKTLRAQYLNVRDILGYDYLIMPLGALKVIETILG
jgi:large subunit ribosomal protein L4